MIEEGDCRPSYHEKKVWPVRYATRFHMTNDSDQFLTRAELEKGGWKPAPFNRWAKGKADAVPLYEGKMVQMYDHRAADVVVNAQNLHRVMHGNKSLRPHYSSEITNAKTQLCVREASERYSQETEKRREAETETWRK